MTNKPAPYYSSPIEPRPVKEDIGISRGWRTNTSRYTQTLTQHAQQAAQAETMIQAMIDRAKAAGAEVNGDEITFPSTMSRDQIRRVLDGRRQLPEYDQEIVDAVHDAYCNGEGHLTPGNLFDEIWQAGYDIVPMETETVGADGVARKNHYHRDAQGRQPWDIMLELGWAPQFAAANVLKYLRRDKGSSADDIKKARWYYRELFRLMNGSTGQNCDIRNGLECWQQLLKVLTNDECEHLRNLSLG